MKKFLTLSLLFVFALITGAFAQTNIAPLVGKIKINDGTLGDPTFNKIIDGNEATSNYIGGGTVFIDLQANYTITSIEMKSSDTYNFDVIIGTDPDLYGDIDLDDNSAVSNSMVPILNNFTRMGEPWPESSVIARYLWLSGDYLGYISEIKIYTSDNVTTGSDTIASKQGHDLKLCTGKVQRMVIRNIDGSVEIGGSLKAGSVNAGSVNAGSVNATSLNSTGNIGIGTTTPGANLSFGNLNDGRNTPDGITWYSPDPLTYGIYRTSGAWSSPNYQQLKLAWNTGIVIDGGTAYGKSGTVLQPNGGNVLIGKTSQTTTGVRYRLDVAGPIRANEVTINSTGADFVFENNYKLRPLSDLENFIKQHKHLPEISPAIYMQTNGMSMGEMQTKLLQKVEELTLYTIEQDKKLKEQAGQNAELQKEIKELKELIMKKLK